MPSPAPKRRDIAGLAAIALVILAFVPLTLHALRRASAHEVPRLSLDAPLPDTVPAGTTLVVGDPLVQRVFQHLGWEKQLPFRIQWTEAYGGPKVNQAFMAKALDVGATADIPPIHATWIGIPVKIVAYRLRQDPLAYPTYTLGIAPGAAITTLADLRGKRIAYSPGQAQGAVVLRTLAAAGIPRTAVTLVNLPAETSTYVDALAARQVDAAPIAAGLQAQRYLERYAGDGARVLAHGAFRDDPSLLYARVETLEDPAKAAALRVYVRWWARAQRWMDTHRRDFVNIYYVRDQGVTPAEGDVIIRAGGALDLPDNWDLPIRLQQQTIGFIAPDAGRAPFPAATIFDRRFEHVPAESLKRPD